MFHGGGEIPAFLPEEDVRAEHRNRSNASCEIYELAGEHQEPSEGYANEDDEEEGREDAPCPPFIEAQERETTVFFLPDDEGGDEVTADHQEDVDTDVTTVERFEPSMEKYDRNDRERTEAVDLCPVIHSDTSAGGVDAALQLGAPGAAPDRHDE